MTLKKDLANRVRGWIPKEPSMPSSNIKAVKAPMMSERDKAVKLKVVSVLLGVLGVFAGWSAAGRAYLYFVGVGVTSYYATVYSVILWVSVIGAFGLAAFKLKRIQQYITKGP
jgi:hypothetical protein